MKRNRCFIVVASASAAAVLLAPAATLAQSAYQQLCRQADGRDCNLAVPNASPPAPAGNGAGLQQGEAVQSTRPSASSNHNSVQPMQRPVVKREAPRKSSEQLMKEEITLGLVQGLLGSLLAPEEPSGPSTDELAEQERKRVAELERVAEEKRISEFQARAAMVSGQRTARNAQQASNMESMAASMSAGFDRPADRLVDVATGGRGPVQLKGTTPALFAPPSYPLRPPPNPSIQRLAKLAAENKDVAVLTRRFAALSAELDAAKKEADAIGRMSRNRTEEYQQMERTVAQGVADARDRGVSMIMDALLSALPAAIARVEEVRSNDRAWNAMKEMLHETQQVADSVDYVNDKIDTAVSLQEDAAFLLRKRQFKEDIAYLAERFGGEYNELGKSIFASARTVREELQILRRQGELEGFGESYRAQLTKVREKMDQLIVEVKKARHEISLRTGIAEKDLSLIEVPPPPGSFGNKPPPIPVK
jgi:hypothetical protein